jgi:hypothetical protein
LIIVADAAGSSPTFFAREVQVVVDRGKVARSRALVALVA